HVDFSLYKLSTVSRRIGRRMLVHRCETLNGYLEILQHQPQEIQALYKDMLICVTSFFRDTAAFESVTPHLARLASGAAERDSLRVWVPGCATGEEVYSLAIVFHEISERLGTKFNMQFFGTDINEAALQHARAGVYSEHAMLTVSQERLLQFFYQVEGGYQINKSIREECVFATQDITRDPPFARLDLISCRNLLIYLGPSL